MKKFFYFAALCCFLFWWCSDDDESSSATSTSQVANNDSNELRPEPWAIRYEIDDYGQPTNNPVALSMVYGTYAFGTYRIIMGVSVVAKYGVNTAFVFTLVNPEGHKLYGMIYTLKFRNSKGEEIVDYRGYRADGWHVYDPFYKQQLVLSSELNDWIYTNLMNGETINAFMEDMDHRKYNWTIIPNNFRECTAQIRHN